jgi:hypothetical protein
MIDRLANRFAYPTSRWRTSNAPGVSVVTESDYGVGVVHLALALGALEGPSYQLCSQSSNATGRWC